MLKNIVLEQISDIPTRDNIDVIKRFINKETLLLGQMKLIEITFAGAVTAQLYPHGLTFIPKDIIQTSITGAGAVTYNYASFDINNISITTTGACVVRFLVGLLQSGKEII